MKPRMHTDEHGWVERPTVRVVLLDARDRVLLFRYEDDLIREPNGRNHHSFWVTPGGALEPGEDYEAAAARELLEETGLAGVELAECLWTRQKMLEWKGRLVRFNERYYLAYTDETAVCVSRLSGHERAVYREYRWWGVDEILKTGEVIHPMGLGALLVPIKAGRVPAHPILIE